MLDLTILKGELRQKKQYSNKTLKVHRKITEIKRSRIVTLST